MNTINKLKDFLTFKGNIQRKHLLFYFSFIMLIRLILVEFYIHLSLPNIMIIKFLFESPMMLLVLYLLGIIVAARLNNLGINPSLTYFWILAHILCKDIFLPLAHMSKNMHLVFSGGILYLLIFLPLFVKDKKTLLFWH